MPTSISKSKKALAVGITLGDPSGIGPEVTFKALSKPSVQKLKKTFQIIGDKSILDLYKIKLPKNSKTVRFGSRSARPPHRQFGQTHRPFGRDHQRMRR